MVLSTLADLTRRRADLVAENALRHQQLIVLHRQIIKSAVSPSDHLWLVLLATRIKNWKERLVIFKAETLLRWHRQGFRLFWKFTSRSRGGRPKLSTETIALIQRMAQENRLWDAERIRGERLKLGLAMQSTPSRPIARAFAQPTSQTRATFLQNHAKDIWACDFLPVIDIWFRPLYLFFTVELASRVIHFGVAQSPTDALVAQQLREATPFGQAPRFLIRDRDRKYGEAFTRVAGGTAIEVLKTPYRAPKANAMCERFLGSVRRECPDHVLVLGERQLYRVIGEYGAYINRVRPHQGIEQQIARGLQLFPSKRRTARALLSMFAMGSAMITGWRREPLSILQRDTDKVFSQDSPRTEVAGENISLESLCLRWTRLPQTSPALDLTRSRSELVLENALLRQQLAILRRQVKRPRVTRRDRLSLLLLAGRLKFRKQAFLIFQPDTLLRWHRQGFRLFGRLTSRARPGRPRLSLELVAWIQQMAAENPLWGTERVRGELLKFGMRIAKDTIHTHLQRVRPRRSPSHDWNKFLKNRAKEVWTCDFLPVIDLFLRTLHVFFIVEMSSRRSASSRAFIMKTDVVMSLRSESA